MISGVCAEHGAMEGLEFVDGVGIHESRRFCVPCRERERAITHPHAGNPRARQLREERIASRLTLREAGDLLGVPWMMINNIQTGAQEPPDDETFVAWITTIRAHGEGASQ